MITQQPAASHTNGAGGGAPNAGQKPQLVGARELAEHFGVHVSTIYQWSERDVAPLPRQLLGRTYIYDMGAVQQWAERTHTYPRQRLVPAPEPPEAPAAPDPRRLEERLARVEERLETLIALSRASAAPGAGRSGRPGTLTEGDKAVLEHTLDGLAQRIISALGQNDREILERLEALTKAWE